MGFSKNVPHICVFDFIFTNFGCLQNLNIDKERSFYLSIGLVNLEVKLRFFYVLFLSIDTLFFENYHIASHMDRFLHSRGPFNLEKLTKKMFYTQNLA